VLHGKIRYLDEHIGAVEYSVYARDGFDDTKLYLMNSDHSNFTGYINGMKAFDKCVTDEGNVEYPYEDLAVAENRRLDIKKTNKFKTNIPNRDFCVRVSAIVRYMQIAGRENYNQNVSSEDDHFATDRVVNVPNLGYIKYRMGLITELHFRSPYVELALMTVPDDQFDEGVFKTLKEKDKYGNILSVTPIENVAFKLASENLGFEYVPAYKKESVNIFGVFETIEQVIENNPEKNTAWILERKYEIVTDANLEQVIAEFMAYDGYIAFDTETTGLKINFKSRLGEADQLVGVVLSKEIGTGYYFPLQHKLFENLCGGDHWYFMEKYMKVMLESKKIICHNMKFDWKVAYIYDIVINCVYDTLLAFGVTYRYQEENFKLGMKSIVSNLLGLDMFDLGDFVTGSSFSDSGITFADLPYELVRRYAPADGDMTLSLFEFLEREAILDKYDAHTVFEMEVNFAKAVAYAEFFGYHIDVDKIPDMRAGIESNMDKYKTQMFKMAGVEFNPSSPKQLTKIMYDDLGIEQIGEKRSTNKEILGALAKYEDVNGDPKYPFVVALKKFRDNEGIFKNFLKKLHLFSTPDGYIFSDTQQLGTDTGRTSAKDPNYQSYNDAVKKYVVPRPGFKHFDSDFSQIEYRVLASMAGQDSLMKEFEDADLDYHTFQASRMFSIPYALVTKALRGQSKGINFGLPYGMGDSSLGARIFGERNKANTLKAAQLRRKFFQGQEKIEQFFEVTRSGGVANGYTSTKFGRRRYYHRGTYSVNEIRRQAGNHVIQGTAADIYKIACNRLFNRIVSEGWLGKVLINVFVHDELLVEVHDSINPYYFFKAWREEFELPIAGFCKLYAGAGMGNSWYEAKKQDLPPQYIELVVNQYHEDMPWDGNTDKFLADLNAGYAQYKVDRIRDYITAPENQGDIIKPMINSLLVEVVDDIIEILRTAGNSAELLAYYNGLFGAQLIPPVPKSKHKLEKLSEYLSVFGAFHGIDLTNVNVKAPDEGAIPSTKGPQEEDEKVSFEDDGYSLEDLIMLRGYYRDEEDDIIYYMDRPMTYSGIPTTITNYLYQQGVFKPEGKLQIAVYDQTTKQIIKYNAFMNMKDYQLLVTTFNSLNSTQLNYAQGAW
jgi:DNA polymerase I-like protein with 3'-5' exonuclease and polymerase domains